MKIQKNAFRFCKWSVAAIVWAGFIFRIELLMLIAFIILLLSAVLTIKYAPMPWLYTQTFGRIGPQEYISLDVKAMRFAHSLGTVFSGIVVLLLYTGNRFGWAVAFLFAVMKTISAAGYCPGEKIYKCMKGGCCAR